MSKILVGRSDCFVRPGYTGVLYSDGGNRTPVSITNAPSGTYMFLGTNTLGDTWGGDWVSGVVLSGSELDVVAHWMTGSTYELEDGTVYFYYTASNLDYGGGYSIVSNPLGIHVFDGVQISEPNEALWYETILNHLDIRFVEAPEIPVQWKYWNTLLEDSFSIYELEET